MKATFFETAHFTANLAHYLSGEEYRQMQFRLMNNPESGAVMPRTGGFRKLRWNDAQRGKGKRGGLRVIYYWLEQDAQIWLFSIYNKDEMDTLTSQQEQLLKQAISAELHNRGLV
jgi:mRNA-degrading endonuclease RelE of RelBE toxin-antitoxin system